MPPLAVGLRRGPNMLPNGDCETTADWTAAGSVLSASAVNPYEGSKSLKVAATVANGYAYRDALTIGKTYRITGVARGDGTAAPDMYNSGAVPFWTGTSATSWQAFDETFVAGNVRLRLRTDTNGQATNWDDLYLEQLD